MAECPPGGQAGKGVRYQFRPGFLKGLYSVCGDIMDVGPSAQTGISSSSCDFVSPSKGTRTRTVREYEQTINELKKENFDLKLRVFLLEESMSKTSRKDKDCSSPDNTVQVIVQLKLETESLRNELSHKNKLLQESRDEAEKLHFEMKELEEKYADLQTQLVSLSELPSMEEYMHLFHEKENLLQKNESLERDLLKTNEDFQEAQQRIEILANQNSILEEKVRKRSLAIQGFVYKSYQEREMFPDELRATVMQATQAARNKNSEELTMAIKNFKAVLCQIMSLEKRRDSSKTAQSLHEESIEQLDLSSLKEPSSKHLSPIQNSKEVLTEKNSLEAFTLSGRKVNVTCREGICERQHGSVEKCVVNISPASVHESNDLPVEDGLTSGAHSLLYEQFLKENVEMKGEVEENVSMTDLKTVCEENLPFVADAAICSANESLFQQLKVTDKLLKKSAQISNLKVVCVERLPSNKNALSIPTDEFHFPVKENEITGEEMCVNPVLIKDLRTVCEEKIPSVENDISVHVSELDYKALLKENAELKEKLYQNVVIQNIRTVCEEKIPSVENIISTHVNEFNYKVPLKENAELKEKLNENVVVQNIRTVCEEKIPSVENIISTHVNEFNYKVPLKENAELKEKLDENVVVQNFRTVCEENIPSVENISTHVNEFNYKTLFKENAELKEKLDENVVVQNFRTVCEENIPSVENISTHVNEFNYKTLFKENAELKENLGENAIQDIRAVCKEKIPSVENIITTHADVFHYQTFLKENKSKDSVIQDLRRVCEKKMPSIETAILSTANEFLHRKHLEGIEDSKEDDIVTIKEKMPFVENDTSSCAKEFQLENSIKEGVEFKSDIVDLRRIHDQEISSVGNSQSDEMLLLKENQELKKELDNKLTVIKDLRLALAEEMQKDALKVSSCCDALVQTNISCGISSELCNMNKLDDGVDSLLLKQNQETRECVHMKSSISNLYPEKDLNVSNQVVLNEQKEEKRSELYERLAFSCSINVELVRHLRTLEAFMEELLQNQLQDSSSLETSNFFTGLSKCLNESLKLSSALSDHLSICEESQLFEEYKSILCKGASFSFEKSLHPIDVSALNRLESSLRRSQQGTEVREGRLSYLNEDTRKESFPQGSSWQQVNSNPEFAHPFICTTKQACCPSSDSDIWSEPDREISLQRIGISLQNSPQPFKSPRKLRSKERRGRVSTDRNTSSSEMRSWPRSKRNGCRRLFTKDSFALEKYYFLLAEKFSKLQSLRSAFQNVEDEEEASVGMDSILSSVDKALHKLEVARDHSPAICGRCALHELLLDLEDSYSSMLPLDSKSKILVQFVQETRLLREECEEPFCSFSKRVRESDPLNGDKENKISDLEQVVVDLNDKNGRLAQNLNEVQDLLSKERKKLESMRTENTKLSSEMNDLKQEILSLQQKEYELSLKNAEQVEKIVYLDGKNCELNDILKVLENQKNASDGQLDQLMVDLRKTKSELENMSIRCLELEKELNEQTKLKEESMVRFRDLHSTASSEKEKYLTDIESMRSERDSYVEELEILRAKLLSLEKENSLLNEKLNAKDDKLCSLVETVETLQNAKGTLNTTCAELQIALGSAKERCQYLEFKCHSQEEEASKRQKTCEEYQIQLQQLQAKFSMEKEKLLEQISSLTLEKDDVLQKLNHEKEHSEMLMVDTYKLNQKLVESGQQLTSLRLTYEQLESSHSSLLQKTQHMQNTLVSSDFELEALRNDLKRTRESLVNLESRCSAYEKEIVASAGMKDNIVECMLGVKNELSGTKHKVCEMLSAYNVGEYSTEEWDAPEFVPVIDEDNVTKLCNLVTSEGKILFKAIDALLGILKHSQTQLQKMDFAEGMSDSKISSIRREIEFQKHEISHLRAQNEHLKKIIEETRATLSENEKSFNLGASENHSLREKLQNSENETEKAKLLLKMKEDEITMLQERIFNLQTYVNSMLVEKVEMHDDLTKPSNERLSLPPLLSTARTPENEQNISFESLPTNLSSPGKRRGSCEKCHSLQKKLVICKRRIEMLEEEKKNLREFHNSSGLLDSTAVLELESKLEQKKTFISELKGELLKVCNSLIDKEREVDDLKVKLSEYKAESHRMLEGLSKAIPKEADVKRKNLKNYKWKLIESICDLQRRFCEQKGINLNYFDKLKSQVNNLYSIQLGQPLIKSLSMPELGSHPLSPEWDLNLKGLEIDIECLENLKLFLNHFFVPSIAQVSESQSKVLSTSSEPCENLSEKCNLLKSEKPLGANMLFIPPTALEPVKKYSNFETAASTISHHLDFMENFFNAVKEYELSSIVNDSFKECEAEDRSLLLQVLREISLLHEEARKLLSLNNRMKATSLLRPDVSDGEESDETVAVSRSETPLYEEEQLSEVREIDKPQVMNHSSCESIHHRSQYSSPDLGIESDPNHEQRDDKVMQISFNNREPSGTLLMGGDSLYAIGALQHFELLRREIQESLVGMRSILSRTGDGLHHIAARPTTTSPRKTLEYSTLRAIKDTCSNVESCLKEAYRMVKKFQIAPCPSEQEWNALLQENQRLQEQITKCKVLMQSQENEYKKALGKLEHAQNLKASMEKKISKKLVKTKKVIRQAELKLLENGCQNCPPLPKYTPDSLLQQT